MHRLVKLRYRYIPDNIIGEILAKPWMDNAVPVVVLVVGIIFFGFTVPGFFSLTNLSDLSRQFAELAPVSLALVLVLLAGGIDVSVGSVFGLGVLVAGIAMNVLGLSFALTVGAVLLVGVACGALNGVLVGYLRLRAFLTTLVTLIIYRSIYDLIYPHFSTAIASNVSDSAAWDILGDGAVFGVPVSFIMVVCLTVAWHVVLSRMGFGWRIMAVGGARRSAHNVGINVRRTVFLTYICSSVMCAFAGLLNAARLSTAGSDAGAGLEISALTAAVLGGTALGGGRGSVAKSTVGTLIVALLSMGLISLSVPGSTSALIFGVVLLLALFVDVRWLKNRHKILNKVYVSPTYFEMPQPPSVAPGSGSPYEINDRLRDVGAIGLGIIEGPEDVILDREDNLFCGNRNGDIIRFFPPTYERFEVFAHVGGYTEGLAFDRNGDLNVCAAGMGLYKVTRNREIVKLSDETNRSFLSVVDDSRLRLADDLDIAPDGRVFFSEATTRFEMHDWPVDALESRGNGRIICYDPLTATTRTVLPRLVFPNGICICHDGQSLLFAETWACRVSRFYFDGPRKGTVELLMDGLPGYPDNINRASDGHYWLAFAGMRSPALDLALTTPGFRRRMAKRCAPDNWLYPNLNTGLVIKFTLDGTVLESLWDLGGRHHPMITSIREHKGILYLAGIFNNRIGTYRIPGANPHWCAQDSYWGSSTG